MFGLYVLVFVQFDHLCIRSSNLIFYVFEVSQNGPFETMIIFNFEI